MKPDIRKAFAAGGIIGLSAYVNLLAGNKYLGAFLFSCGLLTICINEFRLVTGRFGQLYTKELDICDILFMLIFNIYGAWILSVCGLLSGHSSELVDAARKIASNRDVMLWYQHIFSGVICGICIQLAVQNYKKYQSPLGVIMPTMIFILTGSEHCIADSFYYWCAGWDWGRLLQIFEVFCGNFMGATLVVMSSSDN